MSTRAIQDGMMLLGFRDPVTDDVLAGGTVEFYSAGTSNAKNAWEDKDKVTAITSVTLDSSGQAQVYLDGVYKFIVKNSSATTKYNLDNLKFQARNTSTSTKTADYQCTADDDYILVDTDSAAVTITLAAVAGVVAPITIKNIGSSSNSCIVDGSGAETIDGSTTVTLTDGGAQQYVTDSVQWYAAGASSGTTYTTTTLVSGTNNSFDVGSGITTINVPSASNTTLGAIEIATDAEVVIGTSEVLAVNPKQVATAGTTLTTALETKFVSTEVFTGASPTTYADLDLSAVVGAQSRMVYLKVTNGTTLSNFYFRTNGETLDTAYNSSASLGSGASAGSISSGNILYVLVKTDSAGVIEWETSAASTTTTIDVESYW